MNQNLNMTPTLRPKDDVTTPWWSHFITIFVTAIVSVLATVYATGGLKAPAGATAGVSGASIAIDTITYMPHILLLFGVLADMITYDGVWSIPSFVGLLSIPANWIMQFFWKGLQTLFKQGKQVTELGAAAVAAAPAPAPVAASGPKIRIPVQPESGKGKIPFSSSVFAQGNPFEGGAKGDFFKSYDGCSVQGLEFLRTEFAPQTLVVTATVFFYYIFDLVRNRGWVNSAATIAFFAIVYSAQVAVLQMTADNGACGDSGYSHFSQSLMALFEGILFGGSAYGIVQTYYPTRLPSSTVSPFPRKDKSELTMGPDGKMYDKDGYPYVILPNGQAVPDLSGAAARDAFARLAGENLGTGTPARPDNCNAA